MFNWFKKKDRSPKIDCVKPDEETLFKLATGRLDLLKEYLYYEHVNWAYKYLGSNEKVFPSDPVYNKHVIILTGAATQYFDDIGVPYE